MAVAVAFSLLQIIDTDSRLQRQGFTVTKDDDGKTAKTMQIVSPITVVSLNGSQVIFLAQSCTDRARWVAWLSKEYCEYQTILNALRDPSVAQPNSMVPIAAFCPKTISEEKFADALWEALLASQKMQSAVAK